MTMKTTRKELRTLTIPHGIHKSSNNCKSPSRNAAFQACQACYSRKKRCVTSPSHHQCTYCFREGQRCLPRERPVRPTRKYMNESPSEPPRPRYDLPLPHGIDHEVPRWSAMYSMFSEALRLIPPEGMQMNEKRKRDASAEREQSSDRKRSCPTSNTPSNLETRAGEIKEESDGATITTNETDGTKLSYERGSSMQQSMPREESRPIFRNTGAGIFFGELDALLRF